MRSSAVHPVVIETAPTRGVFIHVLAGLGVVAAATTLLFCALGWLDMASVAAAIS